MYLLRVISEDLRSVGGALSECSECSSLSCIKLDRGTVRQEVLCLVFFQDKCEEVNSLKMLVQILCVGTKLEQREAYNHSGSSGEGPRPLGM